jgi:hypothetical protein
MINWKGCGRKRWWLKVKYYPSILSGGTEEDNVNLSQNSLFPGRGLNQGPPDYEARVITIQPQRSVETHVNFTYVHSSARKLKCPEYSVWDPQ